MSPAADLLGKVILNFLMAACFFYYSSQIGKRLQVKKLIAPYIGLSVFMIIRQYLLPGNYGLMSVSLYVVLLLFLLIMYRIHLKLAVLDTLLYYFCCRYVNQTLAWISYQWKGYDYINGGTSIALRILFCSLFAGIVALTITVLKKYLKLFQNAQIEVGEFIYLIIISVPLIYFNHSSTLMDVMAAQLPLGIILSRIAVSWCEIVAIIGFFERKDLQQRENEQNYLRLLLEKQEERQQTKKEYSDFILSKCHDLKKQLFLFQETTGKEYLESYIAELRDVAERFDNIYETGNSVLDSILNEKAEVCRKKDISFVCMIDGSVFNFMGPMDIVSLFSNAIDNAIEACDRIPDGKEKYINVKMSHGPAIIAVSFFNPYTEELIPDGKLYKTVKKEAGHGYGLKSISIIAEKYDGTMTIDAAGGEFALTVLMQNDNI